ncbi:MAG: sodium:proton antiporter [Saprospiraceae bacterium]
MELYNSLAIIIVLAAVYGFINVRYLMLPNTIAVMIMALLTSLVMILVGMIFPSFLSKTIKMIDQVDFYTILMKIMLSFLLFAGSIEVKLDELRKERTTVFTFSTLGVLISTIVVGVLLFFTCKLFHLQIDFIYCLLFGALISPTDPIAVMGILKKANIPATLETKISGESLFNDGVAVVIFISIYEIIQKGIENLSVFDILLLFITEAGGGILLGVILGFIAFWALKSIDHYKVEVMITLALVMGGYTLAEVLHISGPLAMVAAGILIGNRGRQMGMSEETRDYIDKFWEMIDEVLNAILFILIGLEMMVIKFTSVYLWLGILSIFIVLFARLVSVWLPISVLKYRKTFEKNAISILTWGGLRGGISVALALSLPKEMFGEMFVSITYIIVLFSILVQGLTIGKLAKKLV